MPNHHAFLPASHFRNAESVRIQAPPWAVFAAVRDDGHGGSLVSTETRALCPDPQARRKFEGCWRLWTPGGSVDRTQ